MGATACPGKHVPLGACSGGGAVLALPGWAESRWQVQCPLQAWPPCVCLQYGSPSTCPSQGKDQVRTEDRDALGSANWTDRKGCRGQADSAALLCSAGRACAHTSLQAPLSRHLSPGILLYRPLALPDPALRLLKVWSSGVSLPGPSLSDTLLVESPAYGTEARTPGAPTATADFVWSPMCTATVSDVGMAAAQDLLDSGVAAMLGPEQTVGRGSWQPAPRRPCCLPRGPNQQVSELESASLTVRTGGTHS